MPLQEIDLPIANKDFKTIKSCVLLIKIKANDTVKIELF